ncbi:snRNA-activating protein complex subunit 4 [Armadillidium nasatum]|uniref:snRNA-activating protein complex subunit 4 n=1 Tax=Armadillidium nasatum TaxID=96803 RepID=A0A5N5SRK3_9CRUS|nr:snRNA-activating protein complex subunit 4 [Armadillidium nasatum]
MGSSDRASPLLMAVSFLKLRTQIWSRTLTTESIIYSNMNIMNQPSTSEVFNDNSYINSSSLNLSVNKISNTNENEEVDDDIEEVEVDESEKLHLQKVTSFVQAAYERVEEFSKQQPFLTPIPSRGASEASSHTSTVHPLASIPESIDGGRAEIEELKSLPVNFESALRTNQALQRRLNATLNRLEKTLQENLIKQAQLLEEEEDQGIVTTLEKDKEYRNKYFVRPSSFSIPYFKDRCGMPAPMNNDTKYKVDNGYLDLYSTRLRTLTNPFGLTSEHNMLVKEVLKEWKEQLIKDWNSSLRNAERKLKNNSLTEEEITKITGEIDMCKNHINFFTNVSAEKIEIPRKAKLDWDRIAAQTETLLSCNEVNPDWEEIAKNLNTGRTPFQVMQRWVSFIRPAIQPASWTPEASKKLEDTINMLRAGNHIPWALVSQHLTGYTKVQLQSRWRNINPDQYKGPFSTEEDFILIKNFSSRIFDLRSHS